MAEYVTRDELGRELRGLREEMAGMRHDLREEMAGMRQELREEMAGMRQELREEIVQLRHDLNEAVAVLTRRIDGLERNVNRIVLVFGTSQILLIVLLILVLRQVGI